MADDAVPHADVLGSNAQGQLRSIVDRVERLEIEKAEIMEQMKEVYAEAKGNGFDVKILKKVVRKRKQDRAKRQEEEAIEELYESALGDLPLFEPAAARSDGKGGIATITLTMENGSAVAGTPDQLGAAERMLRGVEQEQALYDQVVMIIRRDQKASTSYIQRCLQLNFNHASAIMEALEKNGVVGPPNHAGKREILPQAEAA